jgi:hypothetical protein
MKNLIYNGTLILGIILTISCGQTEKKKTTDEASNQTQAAADTSHYFIKKLLNCSPKDVAAKLGKPDGEIKVSKDCDYLPDGCKDATYQNGKYEVTYFKNMLKSIVINGIDNFNKEMIQYVGFPSCEPTLENKFMIHWRNADTRGTATGPLIPIKGIREVCVLPADGNKKGYMMVLVESDYNGRF